MRVYQWLSLFSTLGIIEGNARSTDCANIHAFVQITDPILDAILNSINKNCIAHYFADCSGQWIEETYKKDGPVLGRELAQGVYQAWRS